MQTDTRTSNKTWYKIITEAKCDKKCGLKKGFGLDITDQKDFLLLKEKKRAQGPVGRILFFTTKIKAGLKD